MLTNTRTALLATATATFTLLLPACGAPTTDAEADDLSAFQELTVPPASSPETTVAAEVAPATFPDGIRADDLVGVDADLRVADPNNFEAVPERLGLPDGYSHYATSTIWGDGVTNPEALLLSITPGPLDRASARTDLLVLVRLTGNDNLAGAGDAGTLHSRVVAVVAVDRRADESVSTVEHGCRDDTASRDQASADQRVIVGLVQIGTDVPQVQRPRRAWAVTTDAITPVEPSALTCEIVL